MIGFDFGRPVIGRYGEFVSIEHDLLYGRGGVPPRPPPRPPDVLFVHCFDCRVPVTPSGRKAHIADPPVGNEDAIAVLHEMTLRQRGGRTVTHHEVEDNVAALHEALGLDVPRPGVRK